MHSKHSTNDFISFFLMKGKYTCLDWRYDSAMVNGIYRISDDDGVEFNVYCDFTSEPNSVWNLLESFSLDKNNLFKNKPFKTDFSYSEDSPNWGSYRLNLLTIVFLFIVTGNS